MLNRLLTAQHSFAVTPNAQNWTLCLQWMLVYQQMTQVRQYDKALRQSLSTLGELLEAEWPEKICEMLCGRSIDKILQGVI